LSDRECVAESSGTALTEKAIAIEVLWVELEKPITSGCYPASTVV
jgi:hypothetical protein